MKRHRQSQLDAKKRKAKARAKQQAEHGSWIDRHRRPVKPAPVAPRELWPLAAMFDQPRMNLTDEQMERFFG